MGVKLPEPIEFEWDEGNLEKNWIKHQVAAKESEEVFFDEKALIFPSRKNIPTEKRYNILGRTSNNRRLNIVFTIRGKRIRVISARDQNKKERIEYEKNKGHT